MHELRLQHTRFRIHFAEAQVCRSSSQRRHVIPIAAAAVTLSILFMTLLYRTSDDRSGTNADTGTGTTAARAMPGVVTAYTYEVVRELPHDPGAFTQGLEFSVSNGRDVFWESTGNYGRSQVREVRPRPPVQ